MKEKTITVGRLLDAGLIKKSTKVKLVSINKLKKAGLIKTTRLKEPVLIAPKELVIIKKLKGGKK